MDINLNLYLNFAEDINRKIIFDEEIYVKNLYEEKLKIILGK